MITRDPLSETLARVQAIADRLSDGSLDDIKKAAQAEIDALAAAGTTHAPGFGHRFHPLDPRAPRLLSLVDEAAKHGAVSGRYAAIGRAVDAILRERKGKPIPMNIDGITAVIYAELGFPSQLGRGLFILSRSVGILAHAWEQINEGGRIKGPMPRSIPYRYVGVPARHLTPGERTRSSGEPAKPR